MKVFMIALASKKLWLNIASSDHPLILIILKNFLMQHFGAKPTISNSADHVETRDQQFDPKCRLLLLV